MFSWVLPPSPRTPLSQPPNLGPAVAEGAHTEDTDGLALGLRRFLAIGSGGHGRASAGSRLLVIGLLRPLATRFHAKLVRPDSPSRYWSFVLTAAARGTPDTIQPAPVPYCAACYVVVHHRSVLSLLPVSQLPIR